MDGAVTYADVKFVKNPETAKNRHRGTGCQAYGGTGEITYAEVKVTQTVGGNVISDSSRTSSKASQLWRRVLAAHPTHILMVTCLLLLVTTIALGVRYSQNSLQLKETQQDLQLLGQHHENLNDSMNQRMRESDGALMDTEDRLREIQRQCNQDRDSWKQTQQQLQITEKKLRDVEVSLRTTKQALSNTEDSLRKREDELTQSKNALNRERESSEKCRGTEADLSTCKYALARAQSRTETSDINLNRVKESLKSKETALRQAEEQLNAKKKLISTLCMNKQTGIQHFSGGRDYINFCPLGWVLIRGKCYFFSEKGNNRDDSEKDCNSKYAKLAVVKSQDGTLKDYIRGMSQDYWIGLKKLNNKWTWSDGSGGSGSTFDTCMAWGKQQTPEKCYRVLPWICEMEASACGVEESFQDCFTI
ncbi:uncharacterized protein LOC144817703 isoform X2 [Lissotriton helveticus]